MTNLQILGKAVPAVPVPLKKPCGCGRAIMAADGVITLRDIAGAWKVRWGIGRMGYRVTPGLYRFGAPDTKSPVLVSANYKLTFDTLRKEIAGLDCWLLILDTKGVNVWCAAGKGTFGTKNLIASINKYGLAGVVEHRTLILPQLGASGVNAGEVKTVTGFTVKYGPVRARDIKACAAAGFTAAEAMRTVRFNIIDRLVLTPVEMVQAFHKSLYVFALMFLLNAIPQFARNPFGLSDIIAVAGAVLMGTFVTPVLLPFIPGRAFAWKGYAAGLVWTAFCLYPARLLPADPLPAAGYALFLPAVSAYLAMNFTGSSTFTSFSGVTKEMKIAVPLILGAFAAGAAVIILSHII